MKHPPAQPQHSQAYQIAAQALKDYVDVLDQFVSNEDAGLKMLHVQKHRLERWYDKLIKQQQELQKTSVNFKGETYHPLIMQRLRANANRVIARVATARSVLEDSPEFVYEQLRHEIIVARRALGKGTSLKEAEYNIAQHSHNIKKLYEQSRPETKQLFGPMDQWLEWGMEYAISLPQADERLHAMLTMPQEITRAKWLFMTALANLSYDIGLEDHHDRPSDNKDLLLISRMMERLARHERGGNNPHMPPNCKLRHNPSIHSIHVVALAKKNI